MGNENTEQHETSWVMEKFTVPGRLLLMLTILGSAFVFVYFTIYGRQALPFVRFPIIVWMALPAGVGFLFFKAAAWVLEQCGIQIHRVASDNQE